MAIDARVGLFFLALVLGGCERLDIVAKREGTVLPDASNEHSDPACERQGPRTRAGDNRLQLEPGAQGDKTRAFCHALCVCTDLTAAEQLTTDVFDSSKDDLRPRPGGGNVAINGALDSGGVLFDIGGSLAVAGENGITLARGAEIRVNQDLEVDAAILTDQAKALVGGDARIGGDARLAVLSVEGILSMPSDSDLNISETLQIGDRKRELVRVEPPCGCDEGDLLDIAELVKARRGDNDNALLKFDISDLEYFEGSLRRELPCGRFFLDRMSVEGPLALSITGRAALYVAGDMAVQGSLSVDLEPDAELDLYLAGSMLVTGDVMFGSKDSSSRARLFIGGKGTLELKGKNSFSGFIYAPRSLLVISDVTEVFGSVFVIRVQQDGPLTIHHDLNPLEAGRDCAE